MMNAAPNTCCLRVALVCSVIVLASSATRATEHGQIGATSEPMPLVFVVNLQNPVESLSTADLRTMLLGERTHWPDGRRVTVVMREPKQPERDAVIRLACRMDDREYTRTVLRAVFTGELQSEPKILATAAGVLRFIYNVPGAIGYVRAAEVDDTVKVIRITAAPTPPAFGFTLRTR